jgi:hypothetical protein
MLARVSLFELELARARGTALRLPCEMRRKRQIHPKGKGQMADAAIEKLDYQIPSIIGRITSGIKDRKRCRWSDAADYHDGTLKFSRLRNGLSAPYRYEALGCHQRSRTSLGLLLPEQQIIIVALEARSAADRTASR